MTTTKTLVKQTWTTEQKQEMTATLFGTTNMTIMGILAKYGPEAVTEFQTAMNNFKAQYFTKLGITSPIALVKAMAEMETNLFGSKIEIWGDEKSASMNYLSCGMWEAMKKACPMTPEQEAKMGEGWERCLQGTAAKFGFTAKLEMTETVCTITFIK